MTVYYSDDAVTLHHGHALDVLKSLPDGSVNCCVTSPPYFGLRDSVTDRLSTRHELLFLFSESRRYWFDLDPIREDAAASSVARSQRGRSPDLERQRGFPGSAQTMDINQTLHERGSNPGDVWTIPTQPFPGAHFAVFPVEIPRRCIAAGCKPGGTVLDPFSGSGTTGLAAGQLGRKYVGVDLSRKYLDLSLKTRLAQTALLDGGAA